MIGLRVLFWWAALAQDALLTACVRPPPLPLGRQGLRQAAPGAHERAHDWHPRKARQGGGGCREGRLGSTGGSSGSGAGRRLCHNPSVTALARSFVTWEGAVVARRGSVAGSCRQNGGAGAVCACGERLRWERGVAPEQGGQTAVKLWFPRAPTSDFAFASCENLLNGLKKIRWVGR
jgi:hypothetical protein